MHRPVMPSSIAPPAAQYAHAVLVEAATRWLHTAGVVPVAADGSVPTGASAQAELVWANIAAILAEAGMGPGHVVSVITYVVTDAAAAGLDAAMAARSAFLGERRVASTLLTVPALAQPTWLLEVAVVAAA